MWRTPEEIAAVAFSRTQVVMINEFHNGLLRYRWTRGVGLRILPIAHEAGVRHLAMEALYPAEMAEQATRMRQLAPTGDGYLAQPEMRQLIQTALDLGWTLHSYEADIGGLLREKFGIEVDFNARQDAETMQKLEAMREYTTSLEVTNWREEMQARNLVAILQSLPAESKLMVWCGNSHHTKTLRESAILSPDGKVIHEAARWKPMGYLFKQKAGLEPFTIHQAILFDRDGHAQTEQLLGEAGIDLDAFGGIAGYLREEIPHPVLQPITSDADAVILSAHNVLE